MKNSGAAAVEAAALLRLLRERLVIVRSTHSPPPQHRKAGWYNQSVTDKQSDQMPEPVQPVRRRLKTA